jgi:hypothetical protein
MRPVMELRIILSILRSSLLSIDPLIATIAVLEIMRGTLIMFLMKL